MQTCLPLRIIEIVIGQSRRVALSPFFLFLQAQLCPFPAEALHAAVPSGRIIYAEESSLQNRRLMAPANFQAP
ncbi:hypothetical protein D3C71_2155620 [compost metagenome]